MDFLPVQRSTNKVDTSINLANDGGSKSNTGYFSNRGNGEEKTQENIDEVKFSKHSTEEDEVINDNNLVEKISDFFKKLKEFILKVLGIKKKKIYNIYEKTAQ